MGELPVTVPKWVWWKTGECVLEVLRRGHFPNTVMVRDPQDREFEVELEELDLAAGGTK